MGDIHDLNAERNKRAQPDPELVHRDDYGRPMFTYLLSYELEAQEFTTEIIAYSMADAAARVEAMRQSLKLDGQAFERIPL